MVDFDLVRDSQSWIDGVGIIEYIELDFRRDFSRAISRFTEREVYLDQREAHPEITRSKKGSGHVIDVPDRYSHIFEYIYLQVFVETHQLGEVTLYGKIDAEEFVSERSTTYEEQHPSENLGHAGLKVLRRAEEDLSDFLKEEVGLGLFTEQADRWARNSARNQTHPSFWIYDLTDVPEATGVGYLNDHIGEFTYLGIGTSNGAYESVIEFYNGGCALARNTRDYFITDIGSFPFRHIITQFNVEHIRDEIFDFYRLEGDLSFITRGSQDGIPLAAGLGVAELARLYNWTLWALKSYYDVSQFAPEAHTSEVDNFNTYLDSVAASRKHQLMNELQKGRYELNLYWNQQRRHFDSIETLIERKSIIDSSTKEIIEEPLSQAQDVQRFAHERVEITLDEYGYLIQRLKDDLDVGLGLDVKRLTGVVIALTIGSILAVLVSSWPAEPYSINPPLLPETSALWILPFIPLALVIIGFYYWPPLENHF